MGTGSFPWVKRPGRGVDHPPPSSAEVEERIELYICSASGPSRTVLGWTPPLPLPFYSKKNCIQTHAVLLTAEHTFSFQIQIEAPFHRTLNLLECVVYRFKNRELKAPLEVPAVLQTRSKYILQPLYTIYCTPWWWTNKARNMCESLGFIILLYL